MERIYPQIFSCIPPRSNNLKKMAMGKIYIEQKLIILLHFWAKKDVSEKKPLTQPCFMPPNLKRSSIIEKYRKLSPKVQHRSAPLSIRNCTRTNTRLYVNEYATVRNCTRISTQLYADEYATIRGWVRNCTRSGAGTILGQGGQDRERQSREREIKFFTEIGAFFCPKNGSGYKSHWGQKSPMGGQNISRGAAAPCPPYFPRLCVRG